MKMKHEGNPAEELLKKVGDLSAISIFGPKVLVAIYLRPNVTAGGIHLTDKAKDEDLYQGKIGLVLKCGPTAFRDADWFADENSAPGSKQDAVADESNVVVERKPAVKAGDWVWFRASNGIAMKFNGVDCRFMEDIRIEGKITEPDAIW